MIHTYTVSLKQMTTGIILELKKHDFPNWSLQVSKNISVLGWEQRERERERHHDGAIGSKYEQFIHAMCYT